MRYSILIPIVAAIASASAAAVPRHIGFIVGQVVSRQNSTADPCVTPCNNFNSQNTACQSIKNEQCYCTSSFAQALMACVNCEEALNSTMAVTYQTQVNQYLAGCQQASITLGPYTVSGFTTTGTSTATSASASATSTSATGSSTGMAAGGPVVNVKLFGTGVLATVAAVVVGFI